MPKNHPLVLTYIRSEKWAIGANFAKVMLNALKGEGDIAQAAVIRENAITTEPQYVELLGEGIAVIPVMGVIAPRVGMFQDACGAEMTSHERIMRKFSAAMSSPDVKSIILLMDSPGGAVTGTSELAQMIGSARGKKQVTAFVRGSADSAAYWIASAAGEIVMGDTAEVGSIGVFAAFEGTDEENTDIVIQSSQSPMKNADPATEEGHAAYQQWIDKLAATMIGSIAAFRGKTSEYVMENFGKGFVLQHDEAVPRGMADRVSTFETVVKEHLARNKKGLKNMSAESENATALAEAGQSAMATERKRLQAIDALDIPAEFEAIRTDNKYTDGMTAETITSLVFTAMRKKTKETNNDMSAEARALAETVRNGGAAPRNGEDAEAKVAVLAAAFAEGGNVRRSPDRKARG